MIIIPMNDKYEIQSYNMTDYGYTETGFCIVEKSSGVVIQDLCMVRPGKDSAEVFVWADKYNEDYTHKFCIGIHEGDE